MKGEASMKISIGFLLLLLGSALPSPVPEVKESNDHLLYPYGTAAGDMKNPKDDDGTSPEMKIEKDFTFYGKTYHIVYVNNNGVVSFGVPVPGYTPKSIPIVDGTAFVAPYWGDVNNLLGGEVFYRETHDPELLKKLTRDINEYFPDIPFQCTWAFIATWDRVAYFGSISKKANTFQAILITNGQTSFVMLNYGNIQWTTGAASGGDRRTGLGGTPAQAGFNSGDDKNYFSIPGSRTPEIINITKTSNVHVPGRWVFQVDDFKVTGIPEELLHPEKEEEKSNSNEEQGQQINEDNEAEPATTRNLPEDEQSQVNQDNEAEEQEKEETEPVPSGNLPEDEQSQVNQDNEVNPKAEEQEKEETEPVPSGDLPEDEQSQVNQDNEVNPKAEEQEKEEMEPVPSGNLPEDEQSQVNQDNEVNPEAEEQVKEEMEPVPSGNLPEEEESHEKPEEEGPQKKEENEGVSAVDVPELPVQKPQLVTEINDDNEESDDCEW